MSTHVSGFFANVPFALITALLWMSLASTVGRVVHRHSVVDIFWGLGFLVVYLESLGARQLWRHWWRSHDSLHAFLSTNPDPFASGDRARLVLLLAVAVWSVRLSGFIAWRQRGAVEDSRYLYIMRGAKGRNELWYAVRKIYLLQALLLWFVSIPLQWVAFSSQCNVALVIVGLALVVIGVTFEAVGDDQLRRFLREPSSTGTTMNRGLWRYTRHPNYFGEAVLWWGFFLFAASTGWGVATVLSPLLMTYLLTSVSGKPLLEGKLSRTRAGYAEYIAATSSFFPWPPRKVAQPPHAPQNDLV